jgi:hypothetical protein
METYTAGTVDAVAWSGITSVPSTWTTFSGLQGALDGKQASISSVANQIIIGNGNGLTTTSTGLTFSANTLTETNLTGSGGGITNIPYLNLINKITVGNGLAIMTGSVKASPNLTLNLSSDTGITINTGVNPVTITSTYTSLNLIGIFNSTQFENVSSLIQIKSGWKPTTTGTADAVAWSGITGIPATWSDTQIPNLAISKISGLQGALDV